MTPQVNLCFTCVHSVMTRISVGGSQLSHDSGMAWVPGSSVRRPSEHSPNFCMLAQVSTGRLPGHIKPPTLRIPYFGKADTFLHARGMSSQSPPGKEEWQSLFYVQGGRIGFDYVRNCLVTSGNTLYVKKYLFGGS